MLWVNGKEKVEEWDGSGQGNAYDFGARIYDPRIGRWNFQDKFKSVYPGDSPYSFALNSPVAKKDIDGNLVLFINGLINWFGASAGPAGPLRPYWSQQTRDLASVVLNDKAVAPFYINGEYPINNISLISTPESRYVAGKAFAERHFDEIIALYKEELKSNPNATIDMVKHSQGAAFGEGMAEYFESKGYQVNTAVHLQPAAAALIPIQESAIKTRIAWYTYEDMVVNKAGMRMKSDIRIEENNYFGFGTYSLETTTLSGYKRTREYKGIKYPGYEGHLGHGPGIDRAGIMWQTIQWSIGAELFLKHLNSGMPNGSSGHNGGPRFSPTND